MEFRLPTYFPVPGRGAHQRSIVDRRPSPTLLIPNPFCRVPGSRQEEGPSAFHGDERLKNSGSNCLPRSGPCEARAPCPAFFWKVEPEAAIFFWSVGTSTNPLGSSMVVLFCLAITNTVQKQPSIHKVRMIFFLGENGNPGLTVTCVH